MHAASKLIKTKKHYLSKYLVSFVIVAASTMIQFLVWDYVNPAPFLFFYPAIILAALYGDGTFAIILSAIATQYYFVPPIYSLQMKWPDDFLRMGMFIVAGLMTRKIIHQQTLSKLQAETVADLLNQEKESRELFVSALSHDLQTPLTGVKLQVQLMLKRNDLNAKDKESTERIHSKLNRIESMIRDLLDANKIRAGKNLQLDLIPCDLRQVVNQAINDLTAMYGERFHIMGKEKIYGYWNCDAIRRILENLCTNAVKYGSPDSLIEVNFDQSAGNAIISVNNKGNPISHTELKHLFDPYHRSETAMAGKERGWGIGLTLVKALVEVHKGEVKAESSDEMGTTFTVLLPLDIRDKSQKTSE